MKLTLLRVGCHLLHESNKVEQELCVVVGQFQIIAVLPEDQTRHLNSDEKMKHDKTCARYYTVCVPLLCFGVGNTTQSVEAQNHARSSILSDATCMS